MTSNEKRYRRLIDALERFASSGELREFWHPDGEQVEHPNVMSPGGRRRALAGVLAGADTAATIVRDQRMEILDVIESGDRMAVQLHWTAIAARDLGPIREGTTLTAHIGQFLEFRDGKLLRLSTYDCYEPVNGGSMAPGEP
ncbi:nuclear transport factor 2 family protein [Actinoplanes sp. NPDC051633]|uniref:nuclear transport factor 2 family protein n=1 Tax=Actinoplanes sp. NPDC051633 TaxID=3155670 RepID=UPI003431D5F7